MTKQDLKQKVRKHKKDACGFRSVKSLTLSAATQAIRRLCTPSIKTGKSKVSKELAEKFLGGSGRKGVSEFVDQMQWQRGGFSML